MRLPYIIVLGEGFPRQQLLDCVDHDCRFCNWFYSMPNCFFVYFSGSANEIDAFIKEKIGDKYRYFISEIAQSNNQGWMPKEHWDIIHNRGADKVYNLSFNGFFRGGGAIPHVSGVYCVYRGRCLSDVGSVSISELLYIGGATDICQQFANHNEKVEWQGCLEEGEELWLTYAMLDVPQLNRCTAALIFLNKPRCNKEGKDVFRHLDTIVNINGVMDMLSRDNFVERTG